MPTVRKEPKPGFLCPITQEIMLDPVILTSSGHTYEREAIMQWVNQNGTDPLTREAVSVHQLIPNRALKDTIHAWLKKYPQIRDEEWWEAVEANNLKALARCILLGVDVNVKNQNGSTALIRAADNDHTAIAHYLVAMGADTTLTNNQGKTAQAVATGQLAHEMSHWSVAAELPPRRLTAEVLQLKAQLQKKDLLLAEQTERLNQQAKQLHTLSRQLLALLDWKEDMEQLQQQASRVTTAHHQSSLFPAAKGASSQSSPTSDSSFTWQPPRKR
jgi:hypothetical protein